MLYRSIQCLISIACACAICGGCDRQSPKEPDDPFIHIDKPAPQAPAAPALEDSGIDLHDPTGPVRAKAKAGDVDAMMTLAQMLRVIGTPAAKKEARQWYQQAADAGNASAKNELKMMDEIAGAATRPAENPLIPAPTTAPADTSAAPSIPRPIVKPHDLSKLAWDEIVACTDPAKFKTQTATAPPGAPPAFEALTTADDHSLMIRAAGKTADDLQILQIVFRVRNAANLSTEHAVGQAATIVDVATRSNVERKEIFQWIGDYLRTQQRSNPVYRNGWSIRFTGMKAEGKIDPQEYLGTAVQIEMTR